MTLRAMAAEGRTVIFISHKLHEVTAVADRVTVLRGGRSIGTVDTAGADLAVPRRADGRPRRRRDAAPRGEQRDRRGRSSRSTGSRPAGDRGERGAPLASRCRCARARCSASPASPATGSASSRRQSTGMRPLTAGDVRVGGDALRTGDPRVAITAGIAHVPEDRLHTGVAPSLSIASNIALKSYRTDAAGPFLRLGRIRDRAVEMIRRYDVKAPGPADAGPPALGRQPAEGRARARVLERAAGARRRGADARSRRRRDRDRSRLSARGRGAAGRRCS